MSPRGIARQYGVPKKPTLSAADRERLEASVTLMRSASKNFYRAAGLTGNHAFIEFTGLMNEYIDICKNAMASGKDFTKANTHSGEALPMHGFQANYLLEKLECIYGASLPDLFKKAQAHR